MNSSNDLKSGQKKLSMQMLILIAVIILVAAVGIVAIKFSSENGLSGAKSGQLTIKLLKDISLIQTNLYKIQSMVVSNQDKKEIERFSDQQAALINEDITAVKKLLESDIGSEQKKFFQGIQGNLTEYQKSAVRFMKLAPAGAGAAYLSAANEKMEAASGLLMELALLESKAGDPGGSSGVMFFAVLVVLAALMVCSVFLIPVFIKSMMNHHVVEPISETAGVLRDYAAGKFSKQLDWDADDAVGELVQTVNILRTKMNSPAAASAAPTAKVEKHEQESAAARTASKSKGYENSKTLSGMVKKAPEHESLVLSSRKAIDRLQDI